MRRAKKVPTTLAELRKTVKEDEWQNVTYEYFRAIRWEALRSNRATKQIPADRGVPDLLVRNPKWPHWCWLGFEFKKPEGGRLSREQALLAAAGATVVIRSLAEALEAAATFERNLDAWRAAA